MSRPVHIKDTLYAHMGYTLRDIAYIVFIYVCVVESIKSFILGYNYCSSTVQSRNLQSIKSCNVHPCGLVRQFPVLQFPPL